MLGGRFNDLQSQFDKESNTNYLDTDQAQSVLKILGKQHDKQNKRIENASAITGASAEAKVNAREKSQGVFDDAITKLAGHGTYYKDMKEREFNRRSDVLNNFQIQHEMGKADQWTNFMNNSTNLGQGGITAGAMGPGSGRGTLMDIYGKNSSFGAGGYF